MINYIDQRFCLLNIVFDCGVLLFLHFTLDAGMHGRDDSLEEQRDEHCNTLAAVHDDLRNPLVVSLNLKGGK